MNKKAYMITPILFIVFFLIAVLFSFHMSKIDSDTAQSIRVSAAIEKGITDVYKARLEQVNFAKISAYKCSKDLGGYNDSVSGEIESCIDSYLNTTYGDFKWGSDIINDTPGYYLRFNLSSVNITNINMVSDIEYIKTELNPKFLI